MTQQGKVLKTDGDFAYVSVERTSACEGCKQKKLCAGSPTEGCNSKAIEVKAKNNCRAQAGQKVLLQSDSKIILFLSFCVFIVPLVCAFAGYFLALSYFELKNAAYITSFSLFCVPAAIIGFYFDKKIRKNPYVEIVKIIDEE